MHENTHKSVNENNTLFSFTFLCKFSEFFFFDEAFKATNMLQLYTTNFLYGF